MKEYEGYILGKEFEINRIIKNRNAFLPKIKGRVYKFDSTTKIKIKMNLNWFVLIFIIVFFSMSFTFLILSIIDTTKTFEDILVPAIIIVFAYILTMFGFKSESRIAKAHLKKIFEGVIVE